MYDIHRKILPSLTRAHSRIYQCTLWNYQRIQNECWLYHALRSKRACGDSAPKPSSAQASLIPTSEPPPMGATMGTTTSESPPMGATMEEAILRPQNKTMQEEMNIDSIRYFVILIL